MQHCNAFAERALEALRGLRRQRDFRTSTIARAPRANTRAIACR